jgi:hypothetical protein
LISTKPSSDPPVVSNKATAPASVVSSSMRASAAPAAVPQPPSEKDKLSTLTPRELLTMLEEVTYETKEKEKALKAEKSNREFKETLERQKKMLEDRKKKEKLDDLAFADKISIDILDWKKEVHRPL